ncbi:GTP-binding protein [Paenibacillus macquariensis subsp. defensor]|nr:GTP-binding protein [Paenibacillus macquariensis subsp. defensor]
MNIIWALMLLVLGSTSGQSTDQSGTISKLQSSIHSAMTQDSGATTTLGDPSDPSQPSVKVDPQKDAPVVKGIYVTAHSAGGSRMTELLNLIDSTELNAMVIDLKDDAGYITYKSDNPTLQKLGKTQSYIGNIGLLMERLQKHNVYPIARIVVFKDTILATKNPKLSFVKKDGTLWKNGNGDAFVNPYSKEVWDYNIELAKEAAKLGFKEIQFDYVRFPEGFEKRADSMTYVKNDKSRVDIVTEFVQYARKELTPLGLRVSVDIFGYAASVPAAEGIGQDMVKISENVDVIAPMVYPSHYSTGWFGATNPDKEPYAVIKGSMVDTHKKLDPLGEQKPIIRPWIQDFTASWLGSGHYTKYGKKEVEEQIRAMKDMKVDEYLLWNANNRYSKDVSYK